jgi:hypothetical protein
LSEKLKKFDRQKSPSPLLKLGGAAVSKLPEAVIGQGARRSVRAATTRKNKKG